MQQATFVIECLLDNSSTISRTTIHQCANSVIDEDLVSLWLRHLIGFVFLSSLLAFVAVVMLSACPAVVLRRMSFRRIANWGQLGVFSAGQWLAITAFGSVTMLFALLGLIVVGVAGTGIGYYMFTKEHVLLYFTYNKLQELYLRLETRSRHADVRELNENNVRTSTLSSRLSVFLVRRRHYVVAYVFYLSLCRITQKVVNKIDEFSEGWNMQ